MVFDNENNASTDAKMDKLEAQITQSVNTKLQQALRLGLNIEEFVEGKRPEVSNCHLNSLFMKLIDAEDKGFATVDILQRMTTMADLASIADIQVGLKKIEQTSPEKLLAKAMKNGSIRVLKAMEKFWQRQYPEETLFMKKHIEEKNIQDLMKTMGESIINKSNSHSINAATERVGLNEWFTTHFAQPDH